MWSIQKDITATAYTVIGSFLGAAAGGAWLGLILMSFTGLYGDMVLWEDLLAGTVAGATVAVLSILCGRAAGRLAGLRVILVAAVAALNVAATLYLFGSWVCEVPLSGPPFAECRIPAPLGALSLLEAILFTSPSVLAAILGVFLTLHTLLRDRLR